MYELQARALARKTRLQARAKERKAASPPKKEARIVKDYLMRLKHRALRKSISFDLTDEWLTEKLRLLRCEATGIEFEGRATEPFGRTIDRKDSNGGYTMDNCWAVCWIYNRCKLDDTHDHVLKFARSLCDI